VGGAGTPPRTQASTGVRGRPVDETRLVRPNDLQELDVPSHRPARLLAAAALALVLPLSACGGTTTSHSSSCSGGTCTVNLTGVQTFEVDGVDGLERHLGVGPIEPDAVTLSGFGEQARLAPGQSGLVDAVPVEVVSVSGSDVTLRIGATEVESADDDDSSASGIHLERRAAKITKTPKPTATATTGATADSRATTSRKASTSKATATKSRSTTSGR
jgi:hypothetical protein